MNLLDSVLCAANASQFSSNFKKLNIDAFTLKLLNDEDLEILGINDANVRKLIVQNSQNLQIPAEKQIEIAINQKYIETILVQMFVQLEQHVAALTIATQRPDTVICNLRLRNAVKTLEVCSNSLETTLTEFEEKVLCKRQKPRRSKLIGTLIITFLGLTGLCCFKYVKQN